MRLNNSKITLYEGFIHNLKEETSNNDWKEVCEKFCEKIGAELLFVNDDNFGYEDKDGRLVHMYADELEKYLKNNKSVDVSAKPLKEDSQIWSNQGEYEYYSNLSRDEMIQIIHDNGWDEEEINGESILDVDDDVMREYIMPQDYDGDYEDYVNSIEPMIEKQCYNDILVLSGIHARWNGKGEACKVLKVGDLSSYVMPDYDATIHMYCDNEDCIYYTEANHDTPMGGTEMYLYSFKDEQAYDSAGEKLKELFDDEEFDMYYFADYAGFSEIGELINAGILTPVKRDGEYVGITESESLTETTNKGIEEKKQTLYSKIRQALKDAGDKDWEDIVGYVKRLPKEKVEELDLEEDEIWCIEMIHSILTYTNNRDIDSLIKNRYLEQYVNSLGEDKVRELLAGEIEEYNNATINRDVYTDSEGVTYNSVTFKDDLDESESNGEKEYELVNADSDKISELEKGSAFTFEGLDISDESIKGLVNFLKEKTNLKTPVTIYTWNGKEFNEKYGLTGNNAYPDDLNFVSISLDSWAGVGNLPMIKLQVGARWLDDIVDNNARRQNNSDE